MDKKLVDYANNAINVLNGLSEDYFRKANIKDRISIITYARKVVNKYHHLDRVQAKGYIMAHQVNLFIYMFGPLFKIGLLLFWEEKDAMLT